MEGGKIMHFHNAKVASQFIQRVLEKKFKRIVQIQHNPTEKRLHMNLIEKLPDGTTLTHHVKFTKTHYHTFGVRFPKWSGEEGESINKEIIDGLSENSIIYFVMTEEIYTMTRKDVIDYNCQWLIGGVRPVYSVPLSALTPFYRKEDWHLDGMWELG